MNKKQILSLILALVMVVGAFTPLTAFAEEGKTTEKVHETTVKIHKILMDKDELNKTDKEGKAVWPKEHDGKEITGEITDFFGKSAKEIDGVAFKIFEVYTGEVE